jgi:7,8-dihydroneopterin aldolase/epimerase/oxygenase
VADRIELRGLRVVAVIGVLPEERERAQPFEVDLDVEADLSAAGASDDLADTIDYGNLVAVAERVVQTVQAQLLERVVHVLADEVLAADARIAAVTVTVRKLRPPVPADLASSAVRVVRRRPSPDDAPAMRAPVTITLPR